ncbi:hypothetical protein Tco_0802854 [Tanacetum coccineum]|uniref:Uncharacterized protein n=1 Tax=Tanacetum coccineum TaxID=301880 RepID=A0ABQ5A2S0_9ASTR
MMLPNALFDVVDLFVAAINGVWRWSLLLGSTYCFSKTRLQWRSEGGERDPRVGLISLQPGWNLNLCGEAAKQRIVKDERYVDAPDVAAFMSLRRMTLIGSDKGKGQQG